MCNMIEIYATWQYLERFWRLPLIREVYPNEVLLVFDDPLRKISKIQRAELKEYSISVVIYYESPLDLLYGLQVMLVFMACWP